METCIRKPYQGVWNIIRFNWHFYAIAGVSTYCLIVLSLFFSSSIQTLIYGAILLLIILIFNSILASFYAYDCTPLYDLREFSLNENETTGLLIHAGLDEVSDLLQQKNQTIYWHNLDFYNPKTHTERSIKRAQKAYPTPTNTLKIKRSQLPFKNGSVDHIVLFLAAHEIRDFEEKVHFFKELQRVLQPTGRIYLTEHLRNSANFLAYTIGFFHFFSKESWLSIAHQAQLHLKKEHQVNLLITTFIFQSNGTTS